MSLLNTKMFLLEGVMTHKYEIIQYSQTVQYRTILYNTVLYNTVQYSTILYKCT